MTTVSLRFRVGAKRMLHIIKERLSFHSAVNHYMALSFRLQRRAPTKVIVFQWPLGTRPIKRSAAHATTTHSASFLRIGGGLVDEDQPGRVKQAPLPHPAPTRPRHVGALLLRRPQAFFRSVMS